MGARSPASGLPKLQAAAYTDLTAGPNPEQRGGPCAGADRPSPIGPQPPDSPAGFLELGRGYPPGETAPAEEAAEAVWDFVPLGETTQIDNQPNCDRSPSFFLSCYLQGCSWPSGPTNIVPGWQPAGPLSTLGSRNGAVAIAPAVPTAAPAIPAAVSTAAPTGPSRSTRSRRGVSWAYAGIETSVESTTAALKSFSFVIANLHKGLHGSSRLDRTRRWLLRRSPAARLRRTASCTTGISCHQENRGYRL
jgi:hypothetical protein